jgi:hypothetical protein
VKAKNLKLVPHDGITEWSVCGRCRATINWAAEGNNDPDDTTCPHCGHPDTRWLWADEAETTKGNGQ